LAAEQINAQGGVLGRNLTIVAEDDDSESSNGDIALGSNALTRLVTVDNAQFVISPNAVNVIPYQDITAAHKTIFFTVRASQDQPSQRVADNYTQYKYYFRVYPGNNSATATALANSITNIGNITGFKKVAYLATDATVIRQLTSAINATLTARGFDVVYGGYVTVSTMDYTSYLSAIDASGAQILCAILVSQTTPSFVKEWYERQSPYVLCGGVQLSSDSSFWNLTSGECLSLSCIGVSATVGFPLTNVTLQTRQTYIQRWGVIPTAEAVATYDIVRYILPDAIRRADTTETDAVIKTLETTHVQTSMAASYAFTSSHDPLITFLDPTAQSRTGLEHLIGGSTFQWQAGGTLAAIGPRALRLESGSTYIFPSWSGPWDNITKSP
jgi:ABC-type branched-subunit amino acid transport system substrate-binding protein